MKAIILAGGSGTRLWPLSRKKSPKQLHKLISDKTLLEETIDRLDFLEPSDIYIATNKEYEQEVRTQLGNIPSENLIVEPHMRDTAVCIGYSAVIIEKMFPDEVISVVYSDHMIQEKKIFQQKLKIAAKLAKEENRYNIIEVKAKYPSVSYGYVMLGELEKIVDGNEVYFFEKFVEKPSLEKAKKMLDSFKYVWNTGLYTVPVKKLMESYKQYLPDTYARLKKIQKHLGESWAKEIIEAEYGACEKISIDYAIMEKIAKEDVRIIPAYLGWSDIGTWNALFDELSDDEFANVTKGKTVTVKSEGCLVYNYTENLLTTYGLKNSIVIQTNDATLICSKEKSGDIKELIETIQKKHSELL